jgi:DNA-binding beta-propeller fold protein YncE
LRISRILAAALALAALLGLAACASTPQKAAEPAAEPETSYAGENPAVEFPTGLEWLNTATPLTLAELKGKVVVLDFWTYGCINCMHNFPWLKRLETEFPNELVVIGVHSGKFGQEGQTANIRQILLRYDVDHPVINDADYQVWHLWGVEAWPTLVIIDPAGNTVGGRSGEGFYPVFHEVIGSLVKEFEAKGGLDRRPLALRRERDGLPQTVLAFPGKVRADPQRGRIFVADTNHNRVVAVDEASGRVLQVIGSGREGFADGPFATAGLRSPQGLAVDPAGRYLYIADTGNHAIRRADLESGAVVTLAGTGAQARSYPPAAGFGPRTDLSSPWDLALAGDGLFIAMAGSHQIWVLDLKSGQVRPVAGSGAEGTADGPPADAELAQPSGIAIDGAGRVFFADAEGSSIRVVQPDGRVGTVAGPGTSLFDFGTDDGVGSRARFQHPLGVAAYEGKVYVADTYNSRIRVVDPASGAVSTLAGEAAGWRDGARPLFYEPGGIDAAAGRLYVADTNNHAMRIVDIGSGATRTLVLTEGVGLLGDAGGDVPVVRLAAATVAPGPGRLELALELPAGYKVNPQAPMTYAFTSRGASAAFATAAEGNLVDPKLPLTWNVDWSGGNGDLSLDLTLVYCESDKESVCLLERVRLEVPVTVAAGGVRSLGLRHSVKLGS